jgi:hypothetical protein
VGRGSEGALALPLHSELVQLLAVEPLRSLQIRRVGLCKCLESRLSGSRWEPAIPSSSRGLQMAAERISGQFGALVRRRVSERDQCNGA